jgi:hypothetical protein
MGQQSLCIIEAKKDNVEQDMAEDLVGYEVAEEVGELDFFHGIVIIKFIGYSCAVMMEGGDGRMFSESFGLKSNCSKIWPKKYIQCFHMIELGKVCTLVQCVAL